MCDEACLVCSGSSNFYCQECESGYFKQLNSEVCLPYCPSGYRELPESNSCERLEDYPYCVAFDTKDSAGSLTTYYRRGIYFDGASTFTVPVVLDSYFTIEIWVRPLSDGVLWRDGSDGFSLQIVDRSYIKAYFDQSKSLENKVDLGEWQHVAVVAKTLEAEIFINGITHGKMQLNRPIIDDETIDNTVGLYFTGYIYSICVSTLTLDTFTIVSGLDECNPNTECGNCPQDPDIEDSTMPVCLITCEFDEYPQEDACVDCPEFCQTASCINDELCNCPDGLCQTCNEWDTCDVCKENASGEPCSCNNGWYEDDYTCQICEARCATCTAGDNLSCQTCKTGNYKQDAHDICIDRCATGFSQGELDCTQVDNMTFTVTFDNRIPVGLFVEPVPAPTLAVDRGVHLSEHSLLIENIMMFQTYTIELWIRADSTEASVLYSVTNTSGSSLLALSLSNGKLWLASSFIMDGPSVTRKTWQFIGVMVTWDNDKNYTVEFEINEVTNGLEVVPDAQALLDNYTYSHIIANNSFGEFPFIGFLYSMTIYPSITRSGTTFPTCDPFRCSTCPIDEKCLIDCDLDTFPDD